MNQANLMLFGQSDIVGIDIVLLSYKKLFWWTAISKLYSVSRQKFPSGYLFYFSLQANTYSSEC